MTKFHLFSQDSVRLETAPTGVVRKSSYEEAVSNQQSAVSKRRGRESGFSPTEDIRGCL